MHIHTGWCLRLQWKCLRCLHEKGACRNNFVRILQRRLAAAAAAVKTTETAHTHTRTHSYHIDTRTRAHKQTTHCTLDNTTWWVYCITRMYWFSFYAPFQYISYVFWRAFTTHAMKNKITKPNCFTNSTHRHTQSKGEREAVVKRACIWTDTACSAPILNRFHKHRFKIGDCNEQRATTF